MIQIKRSYEKPSSKDCYRILVDRIWPRGLTKSNLKVSLWLKEIAPSTELRKWFNHDPKKWNSFETKYRRELQQKQELLNQIKILEKKEKVITLIYSAKDTKHNQAVVLQAVLK